MRRKLLFAFLIALSFLTAVLAWRAGFFSTRPTILAPNENSLLIMGVDHKLGEKLRDRLELTGFMARDTQYVAIVNSQVVERDGVITIDLGVKKVELIVKSISADKIVFGVPH